MSVISRPDPDCKGGIFSTGVFDVVKHVFNHRITVESGLLAEPL